MKEDHGQFRPKWNNTLFPFLGFKFELLKFRVNKINFRKMKSKFL
jgi:hypothetical protein